MKIVILLGGPGLLFVALLALWVAACSGPRPVVESVALEPPANPDHPYRVQALVRNRGRNAGDVSVSFELIGRDGQIFRSSQTIEVRGHESVVVATQIDAPPGDYEAKAKAEYPPK